MPGSRFFQIHLSTAVVLMFATGLLMWANLREQRERVFPGWDGERYVKKGWPFTYKSEVHEYHDAYPGRRNLKVRPGRWQPDGAFVDALIAFVILYILWRESERIIARKAEE